jgi:purine-nucleoside phosphorylase
MSREAEAAANILFHRCGPATFDVAVVTGTGLSALADAVEQPVVIPYADLPGFPTTLVSGHPGSLVVGYQEGVRVAYLQGRAHFYETGDPACMADALETMALMGTKTLLLTCAAGSVRADIYPGMATMVTDHINLNGFNPLIGLNENVFINLNEAYDKRIQRRLKYAAQQAGVTLHEGVYMWFSGPSFETPAEIRMARLLGADLVGMSIVPEVILARRLALHVGALAVATNFGAGFSQGDPSHAETRKMATNGSVALKRIIRAFLRPESTRF